MLFLDAEIVTKVQHVNGALHCY